MMFQEFYTDASEDDLIQDVQTFIGKEYDVDFNNGRYTEVEVDPENFPDDYLIFNPTPYHRKTKLIYKYAIEVATKARYVIRESGGFTDEYPRNPSDDITVYVTQTDNEGYTMYQRYKDEIDDLLAGYDDFTGIFGALDMMIHETARPFKENNLNGTIHGFYNQIVAKAYGYNKSLSREAKLGLVKDLATDIGTGLDMVSHRINDTGSDLFILQVPPLNYVLIADKIIHSFYTLSNYRRGVGGTGLKEFAGVLLSRFLNKDRLPESALLNSLTKSKEELDEMMRLTVDTFKAVSQLPEMTINFAAQLKKRFIEVALLLSSAREDARYNKIIETMNLNEDDLVYRHQRVEYRDYTIEIEVKDGRAGNITSFLKNGELYRHVDVPGASTSTKTPFYRNKEVVLPTYDWFFTSDVMNFMLADARRSKDEKNKVNSMEDMVYKMMLKNTDAQLTPWFQTFSKNVKTIEVGLLKPGFFYDPNKDSGYRMSECLAKLKQFSEMYFITEKQAFEHEGYWYTLKSGKLAPFKKDMSNLFEDRQKELVSSVNSYLNVLRNENEIPIKLLENDDEDLINLCSLIRNKVAPLLDKLDVIRKDYFKNRVVKSEVFGEIFVDKKGKHSVGKSYMPEYVKDVNKCFSDDSKVVYNVNDGKIMFRRTFYDLGVDDIVIDTELNRIMRKLDDNNLGDDDVTFLIDNYKRLIPALFNHSSEISVYDHCLRHFCRLLEVYSYDMSKSDSLRVIIIETENCPQIYKWMKQLFFSKKNVLGVDNTRDVTDPATTTTTSEIPPLVFDDNELPGHRKLEIHNHTFFVKNDKPTLYMCDMGGDRNKPWINDFIDILDYFHFNFKLIPARIATTMDFYTLGVTTEVPISHDSQTMFIKEVYPDTVWKQLETCMGAEAMKGDSRAPPSKLLISFMDMTIDSPEWYTLINVMTYIAENWMTIRNRTVKDQIPRCNLDLTNKTVERSPAAVRVITPAEFEAV